MKEAVYQYRNNERSTNEPISSHSATMNPALRTACWLLGAILLALPVSSSKAATLDDLKKLEITYEKMTLENGQAVRAPDYSIEWRDGKRSFSVESAAEGVGDRNLMEEEDTEETELKTMLVPGYILYPPK